MTTAPALSLLLAQSPAFGSLVSWHETLLRIAIAAVAGAVLGWERERAARPAGLRTHMMLAMGSAGFTLVAMELINLSIDGGSDNLSYDPIRVLQAVGTGVGFIGAGTILHKGDRVRGLTTATGLWIVAAIGVAAGVGLYTLAGILTVMAAAVLIGLRPVEQRMNNGRDNDGDEA